MATKAEEVFDAINQRVEGGQTKAEAFKELAASYGQPVHSLRGSYYRAKTMRETGHSGRRSRRRETTPADAVESAKAVLVRSIEAIDQEVEVARQRATEASAEAKALERSASARKAAIEAKIAVLDA
jgi:predicted  nucleic acid-binding Zn-ribbon protein